ncbi:MAG: acyltransferase [Bacteroidales bacterium]|nr:acyltransferase [Bacteroidales bacterium]
MLRLVSMLMVVGCHALGYVNENDLTDPEGVLKLIVSQFLLVCVNVFVMISGWFGIKASWKGLANLLFQVFFCAILCFLLFLAAGLPVSFRQNLAPYLLFGSGYWFVVSYLILYAVSPVLNTFVQNASKRDFVIALAAFFLAEFIFGYLLDVGHFDYGFSPLFFIGLYLLARYARLYPGKCFSMAKRYDILIYIVATVLSIFGFYFGYKLFGMGFHLNHYDSPLAVAASLFLLIFFSKLNFKSKAINWLATSAFAIYLFHTNNLIYPYFKKCFEYISSSFTLPVRYCVSTLAVVLIALICILADKPRVLIWKWITNFFKDKQPRNAIQ